MLYVVTASIAIQMRTSFFGILDNFRWQRPLDSGVLLS